MTSTTYSNSKFKQGLSVFLWTLKTNRVVLIVYVSILAFFGVFNFATGAVNETGFSDGFMMFETYFTSLIIGLIVSIRAFSYLHSKRQTDLVGSMPVSRRTMFFSRMIAAAVIAGVPLIAVNFVIQVLFRTPHQGYDEMFLGSYYTPLSFLYPFVGLFANIALFGLLSVCCGKTSEKIVSFAGINIAAPFAVYSLMILPAMMLMGYSVDVNPITVLILSPAFSFLYFNVIYWLIFSAVCVVLSFFLIKNRKAESAQSHFAYKFPLVAIKVLVSFSAGVISGFVMALMNQGESNMDYVLFWTGMIFGSFLAHLIIQLIFNHGTKGFLKGLIPYGAMLLCFVIFFTSLNFGFFGYESFVPDAKDVKSVSFTGNIPCYVDGVNIMQNEITDKKIINKAIAAHKQSISRIDEYKHSKMFSRSRVNYLNERGPVYSEVLEDAPMRYFITYTMNDGRKITRVYENYYGDDTNIESEIEFLKTEEYKKNTSPVFVCDEKYLVTVDIDTMDDSLTSYNIATKKSGEKCRRLLETFKKEYNKYGYEDESTDYTLYFYYGKMNDAPGEVFDIQITETITVPETFKETIKLIKNDAENTVQAGR